MTLLELLVKELPKRGGWPKGAFKSWQSSHDGEIYFDSEFGGRVELSSGVWKPAICSRLGEVTREQYEAEISNKAEPENKVTRLDILDAINIAVSMKLEDAMELTETLMDAFDIKHK